MKVARLVRMIVMATEVETEGVLYYNALLITLTQNLFLQPNIELKLQFDVRFTVSDFLFRTRACIGLCIDGKTHALHRFRACYYITYNTIFSF
jgi:hypothetical protein